MRNPDRQKEFRFKQFAVSNSRSAMKIGTDSVLLGAWAFETVRPHGSHLRILDVGTGTGVLSLMLAQRFSDAAIYAVEIDSDAAEEASLNFRVSPWSDRLNLIHADFIEFDFSRIGIPFDYIISNPPYFGSGVAATDMARQVARHQDSLPLGALFSRCSALLSSVGRIAVVLPSELASTARFEAGIAGFEPVRECRVISNRGKMPKRILMEFSHKSCADGIIYEEIAVQREDSPEYLRYKNFVSPFYIHEL